MLSFGGSRTYHRMTCAIEDAGFEIRDQIMWVYGSGFPKSKNIDGGFGTALKPAHEPICVARKPLEGTVDDNFSKWGTGVLNIGCCRVGGTSGRWPANFIHDGGDDVIGLFPDCTSGKDAGVRGKGGIWKKSQGIPCGPQYGDSGSAARFFYCPKASKKDRDDGCDGMEKVKAAAMAGNMVDGQRLGGDGTPISTPTRANIHPTVKPTLLMRYLCQLVTPMGGTVLDPFMGSGSTGRGAVLSGFGFIGIELSPEYAKIATNRINAVVLD